MSVQGYNSDPFSMGAKGPNDEVLKITIWGLLLSVEDSAAIKSLEKLNVSLKSKIKYEKIRHLHVITHRTTSVLNKNGFLYVEPLPKKIIVSENCVLCWSKVPLIQSWGGNHYVLDLMF